MDVALAGGARNGSGEGRCPVSAPPRGHLRIAFVSLHTSPIATPGGADAGGMNVVELNSALALARAGHRVDLIARRDEPQSQPVVQVAEGVRLINLAAGPARPVAKSRSESLIEPFRGAMAQLSPDYDIIHSHHWFSGVAALPLAQAWGVPHIQSFHSVAAPAGAESLFEGEPPESAGRVAGEAFVAAHSQLVIAVSEAERRTVHERYGRPMSTIDVVRPGVDLELFRPLAAGERPWSWGGERPYLLCAARPQPLKGSDLALRMLARFPAAHRPHLVLAGEPSEDFSSYGASLHRLVAELGLAEDVTFLGSQSRESLATILRGAFALLNPSFSETFGLICLEAEASGCPVIASRVGGLPEAVADGRTGFLVPDREPSSWAGAARRLLGDRRLHAQMSRAAREFAQQHSWEVSAAGLEHSYHRVLGRQTAPSERLRAQPSQAQPSQTQASCDERTGQ